MSRRCGQCRTEHRNLEACTVCGTPTRVDRDLMLSEKVVCATCYHRHGTLIATMRAWKTCVTCGEHKTVRDFRDYVWRRAADDAKICTGCEARAKDIRARLAKSKRKCNCKMKTHTDRCALRDFRGRLQHPGWDVILQPEHEWLESYSKRARKEK